MKHYTQADLEEALKVFRYSMSKCEKAYAKLKDGSWQKEWTAKQITTFNAAVSIMGEVKSQTNTETKRAIETLKKLVVKVENMRPKFKEDSPQKTLLERKLKAFELAINLMEEQLK